MKQDEKLDDLFRNSFNLDFSEEIPDNFLSDINQRLDNLEKTKRKKRTLVFWWVTGIFSLLGVILFAYSFSKKTDDHQNAAEFKTTEQNSNVNQSVQTKKSVDNKLIVKQNHSNTMNSQSNLIEQYDAKSKENSVQKDIKSQNQSASLKVQYFDTKSKIQRAQKTKSFDYKTKVEQSKEQFQIETSRNKENNTNNQSDSGKAILASSKEKENTEPKDSNTIEVKKDTTNQLLTKENTSAKNLNATIKTTERKLKYTIGFYSGVSKILHKVLSPNPAFSIGIVIPWENYRDKRKMEESSITSWDMTLRFGIQFQKFTFSSGIDYFVWGEQTDYSNVSYNAQFQNNYRYINIPLFFGYQFHNHKGAYGIQPSCGISMGFLANQVSGYYLSLDNSTSSYQANINKITGTLHAGVEFAYFSQSGIKVSLSPIFRQALAPIVQSEIVRNRYSSFGLQLGIGYRW